MEISDIIETLAISLSGKAAGSRLLKLDLDTAKLGQGLLGNQYESLRAQAEQIAYETLQRGDHIFTIRDSRYPQALRRIYNPPASLFLRGNLSLLEPKRFSIVGTRNPSLLSCHWVKEISQYLSAQGFITVSGMAAGIDEIVHRNSPIGTIAVLAGGLDHVYPSTNRDLYERSRHTYESHNVLMISEMPPGAGIRRHHFVKRNRIIAALSPGVLFAEGGQKSGALITAEYARKYHKEVFVLDHQLQKNNEGAKTLIQSGARDAGVYFPVEIFDSQRHASSRQENPPIYLGESHWVRFNSENFSLKFLSPVQQDLAFERQTG